METTIDQRARRKEALHASRRALVSPILQQCVRHDIPFTEVCRRAGVEGKMAVHRIAYGEAEAPAEFVMLARAAIKAILAERAQEVKEA